MANINIPLEVYPIPKPSQKQVVFPRKCIVCGDSPVATDSVETGREVYVSTSYQVSYKYSRYVGVKGFLENLRLDFPLCHRHRNHREDCRQKLHSLKVKGVAFLITGGLAAPLTLCILFSVPPKIGRILVPAALVLAFGALLYSIALLVTPDITDRKRLKRGNPPVYHPAYGYSTGAHIVRVKPEPIAAGYCNIYVANEEIAKEITWRIQEVSTSQPRQLQAIESEPETAQADLNELCDELLLLLTDYLKREPKTLKRTREIGEQLNQEGGFELMQRVGRMVQARDPLKASWLNNAWDGIGDWRS